MLLLCVKNEDRVIYIKSPFFNLKYEYKNIRALTSGENDAIFLSCHVTAVQTALLAFLENENPII